MIFRVLLFSLNIIFYIVAVGFFVQSVISAKKFKITKRFPRGLVVSQIFLLLLLSGRNMDEILHVYFCTCTDHLEINIAVLHFVTSILSIVGAISQREHFNAVIRNIYNANQYIANE